jgi:hypothetical protein
MLKTFVVTHAWKILLTLGFCAALVLGVQFLRIARYEYIETQGQYLLRIDRLRGHVCWIAPAEATASVLRLTLTIEECD